MLFAGGDEAVEGERVLADVSVDEKSDFGVEFAHSSVGRERNLHQIAYAVDIDKDLVRAFFGKASAELANHGRPVLPPFVRLSTSAGDSGYSRKKGTTRLAACARARPSRSAAACDAYPLVVPTKAA